MEKYGEVDSSTYLVLSYTMLYNTVLHSHNSQSATMVYPYNYLKDQNRTIKIQLLSRNPSIIIDGNFPRPPLDLTCLPNSPHISAGLLVLEYIQRSSLADEYDVREL